MVATPATGDRLAARDCGEPPHGTNRSSDAAVIPAPAGERGAGAAAPAARRLPELEARHSAISAAFLDGATYEELAVRMSVPLGTTKS
jgi:hypothetical protein